MPQTVSISQKLSTWSGGVLCMLIDAEDVMNSLEAQSQINQISRNDGVICNLGGLHDGSPHHQEL